MKVDNPKKNYQRFFLVWPKIIVYLLIIPIYPVCAEVLRLSQGYNQIAYPANSSVSQTCGELVNLLGVGKISRFDPVNQTFIHCSSGQSVFSIRSGEGYVIVSQQAKNLSFISRIFCPEIDLLVGVNLIAVPVPIPGTDCHTLLQKIGDPSGVSAVQYFDKTTGRFQSCRYEANQAQPKGSDFTVSPIDAYLVHMRQSKTAMQLNDIQQCNATPISCDESITADIEQLAEEDAYLFQANSTVLIELSLSNAGGEFLSSTSKNSTATLVSPAGEDIEMLEANINQKIVLPIEGNYIIKISANDQISTGSYRLAIACILPPLPPSGV